MKIRMSKALGGSWPDVGEVTEVEDWRGEALIGNGWAEPADTTEPAEAPTVDIVESGEVPDG